MAEMRGGVEGHARISPLPQLGSIPSRPWACGYRYLWDSINLKKHPWASNPWTWCITFKML